VPPFITFLSDYGRDDDFVGICHGVIARIAPEARVIDLTHGIPRHGIGPGALALRGALPYVPVGVHLAVVDPEVGAARRAVALECADGRLLVGPDNGVLWPAAQGAGGVVTAMEVGHSPWRLEPVSATFHGRDIFAPVAAHLAAGAPLEEAGTPCERDALVALELPRPRFEDGVVVAHALARDRFGNVQLDVVHEDLRGTGLRLGRPLVVATSAREAGAQYGVTFADVPAGALLVYEDSRRHLAVAVNRGSAAAELGIEPGGELRLRPA
jgi:S-adenosyl-L-methionine hydrolase (adenosine-forming)